MTLDKPGTAWTSAGRRPPHDPMVQGDDVISRGVRWLWHAWVRLMTDEEGL